MSILPQSCCLLCAFVYMVLWYNAVIVFSPAFGSASSAELRSIVTNGDGWGMVPEL